MPRYYKITLPTKSYIARYLAAQYGDPLVFSTTNYFGTTLLGYLTTRCAMKIPDSIRHKHVDEFNHQLIIYMPRYFVEKQKFMTDLPVENIVWLNKTFENRFCEDLARYTMTLQLLDVPIKDAIEDFCQRHQIEIEEHITLDNIYKKEQRARQYMAKRGLIPSVPVRPFCVQGLLY